jgi:DNA-binding XRE family transcriptional regulator
VPVIGKHESVEDCCVSNEPDNTEPGRCLWEDLFRRKPGRSAQTNHGTNGPTGDVDPSVPLIADDELSRQMPQRFADGLRRRRREINRTLQDVADLAGISVTMIAMIERGERTPSLETALRICWALDAVADHKYLSPKLQTLIKSITEQAPARE